MNSNIIKNTTIMVFILILLMTLIAFLLNQTLMMIVAIPLSAITCTIAYSISTKLQENYTKKIQSNASTSIAPIILLSSLKIFVIAAIFVISILVFKIDILGLILGVSAFYLSFTLASFFSNSAEPSAQNNT